MLEMNQKGRREYILEKYITRESEKKGENQKSKE